MSQNEWKTTELRAWQSWEFLTLFLPRSTCAPDAFDRYVRGATVAAFFPESQGPAGTPPPANGPAVWAKVPEGAIDVVADGDYATQLERAYAVFPSKQIHVTFFDDVVADPLGVLDELQQSLGIPYHDFEPQLRRRKGRFDVAPSRERVFDHALEVFRGKEPRDATKRPPMRKDTRLLLRDFYARPLVLLWKTLHDHGDLHVIPPASWSNKNDDDVVASPRFRRRRSPRVPAPGAALVDEEPP